MFNNNLKSIYELCSENTETALNVFCDCINHSKADLFVVMSQKAVCLFRWLLAEGKINDEIRNRYVSSSAIDFDITDYKGKSIAIVDDIIISGSAISIVANNLISKGVCEDDLEIIALARNSDYQGISFAHSINGKNLLKCHIDVQDAECIEISYDISHILAFYGQQYDADFPIYDGIKLDASAFKNITNSLDWSVYNISNDIHKKGKITALVLLPNETLHNKIWEVLGVNLNTFIKFKLRLYFRDLNSGKSLIKIVPMALFNEITESHIDLIIKNLKNGEFLEISKDWSYKAKIHFLQFYLADVFCKLVINNQQNITLNINPCDICVNFGFITGNQILEKMNGLEKVSTVKTFTANSLTPDILKYDLRFDCDSEKYKPIECGYQINNFIYNAIKWWYITQELPAREKLKKEHYHYLNDYTSIKECLKRLSEGFSFNALKLMTESAKNTLNLEHLISLFLDRSIDEGIIVPIIYHNCDTQQLCRAYRHGEDLPFGEADKSRLLYFLNKLNDYLEADNQNQTEKFADVSFNKILVLFYQLGLKDGHIFNRFLGFDNDEIIQQRFTVHGIVAAVAEHKLGEDNYRIYLSNEPDNDGKTTLMLVRKLMEDPVKYIEFDGDSHYSINKNHINEFFRENQLNNISAEIQSKISLYAKLIESWYWLEIKRGQKKNFKDNISALTSCSDIYTFASSIATEVHYFKQYWKNEAINTLNEYKQQGRIISFKSEKFDQSLPSAREKHIWFKEQQAKKVIQEVSQLFADNGLAYEQKTWDDLWRKNLKTELIGSYKLQELVNKILKYLYFYSECYDWLCAGKIYRTKIPYVYKYRKQYADIPGDDILDPFTILSSTERKTNEVKKIAYFISNITSVLDNSEKVICEIEECLNETIGTYTLAYNSAIVIELGVNDSQIANGFWREIWSQLKEDEKKTDVNIIELPPKHEDFQRHCVLHTQNTETSLVTLLEIYNLVHIESCKHGYSTRAILMPVFPQRMRFTHNLRANIDKHRSEFLSEFNQYEGQISYTDNVHQLWLMKTDDVSQEISKITHDHLSDLGYSVSQDESEFSNEKIELTYDVFTSGNKKNGDKILTSTVKVFVNDQQKATGTLLNYKGTIYCITCQHILDNDSNKTSISCITQFSTKKFDLKPLRIINKPSSNSKRKAEDEILIASIDTSTCPNFLNNSIFTSEDCETNISEEIYITETLSCFGYGKNEMSVGYRASGISYNGQVGYDFLQFSTETQKIEEGFSGSGIVCEKNGKICAIHVRSDETDDNKSIRNLLGIPMEKVILEIKTLRKEV